jgi:hypothetical protein
MSSQQGLQGLYSKMEADRQTFLDRARSCAKLTIPSILTDDYHTPQETLPTPYQGLGARGTNNLASKLLLALLPPNASFFRLTLDEFKMAMLQGMPEQMGEIEESLARIEQAVMNEVERSGMRVKVFEALKHLIVTGNVLLYLDADTRLRVFHLDQYVVRRDPMGNLLCIITKECIGEDALPEDVRRVVEAGENETGDYNPDKTYDLYTKVYLEEGKYEVYQEVKGIKIPNSYGTYSKEDLPWIVLRMSHIADEDYGRGHVEEFLGDLISLEGLTQAIVEGSAAAARLLFLVAPNGTTRIKDCALAPNGGFISGNAADVTVLQAQKQADLGIASQVSNSIEQRLSFAFLMNSAIQRNAERVTAEEIRYMAQELESALGGVYSVLAQEFQLPLVRLVMKRMTKAQKLPKLNEGVVSPVVITGIEALGRGHDLNKLDMFVQGAAQALGPQALAQYINVSDYFSRRAAALGINPKGLIKSAEQMQQEAQQAQMMQMAQQLGPKAIDIGGKAMMSNIEQQAAAQE